MSDSDTILAHYGDGELMQRVDSALRHDVGKSRATS